MSAIFVGSLAGRLVHYAAAGTLGNVIVKGAARARPYVGPLTRKAVVKTMAGGIVGARKLGDVAEEARLQAGDLLAEARATLGEEAPAPGEEFPPAEAPAGWTSAGNAADEPITGPRGPARKTPPARKAAPRPNKGAADHGHEH